MPKKRCTKIGTRGIFLCYFWLFLLSLMKDEKKKTYTLSVSMFFGFQGCSIFETFLCIIVHPKAEEGSWLKIEGSRPIRRYYLGLHCISKSFLWHFTHQVTQAASGKHSWWYHGPTIDELQSQAKEIPCLASVNTGVNSTLLYISITQMIRLIKLKFVPVAKFVCFLKENISFLTFSLIG